MYWLLLLSVLVFSFFATRRKHVDESVNRYFQVISVGVIGAALFGVWPFGVYLAELMAWPENLRRIYALCFWGAVYAMIGAAWWLRIGIWGAVLSVLIFFASVIVAFPLNAVIKNRLAEFAGYYADELPLERGPVSSDEEATYTFYYQQGGLSIALPQSWRRHQHAGGEIFFERALASAAEGQPSTAILLASCFHSSDIVVTALVDRRKERDENMQSLCAVRDAFYVCELQYQDQYLQRPYVHEWFAVSRQGGQNIGLKFVLPMIIDSFGRLQIEMELQQILRTIQIDSLTGPLPRCLGMVDWY